ncbi:MAG: photosystem II protein PsbQ, partial [Prochloron sp. SP5CPC1]|nr:photosystem II protein PsbQ [Candidatus Paraprochloron terpiosi SP5CPC1]
MKRFFHSLLSLMLVVATTLLVSCSSTSAKAPTTYTSEKIAQLQTIVEPIEAIRERMPEVENLIEDENWVDTVTMIHGPFGQLRSKMTYLSRSLLPKDQK